MISPKHSPTVLLSTPKQTGATLHAPNLLIWFHRFKTAEEPESNLNFDPSDISYSHELRCPNCDRISSDSICSSCGTAIKQSNSGETPWN